MNPLLTLLLFIFSPLWLVAAGYAVRLWREGEFQRQSPLEHRKILRYPGYSLGRQIDRLSERLDGLLLLLFLVPTATAVVALATPVGWGRWCLVVFYTGVVGWIVWCLFHTIRQGRNSHLGLRGEQVVGHTLSELLRRGFHVFHDVEIDGGGNIDHVAVGPTGVFAIESKWRRKSGDRKSRQVIRYDGKTLTFPDGQSTDRPLKQAKRQAARLSELLRPVAGSLFVRPVLVYPGWAADRTAPEVEVLLLHEDCIVDVLADPKTRPVPTRRLDPREIDAIAAVLRARCCDVAV